jgi:SAM-dependent methyltransferase
VPSAHSFTTADNRRFWSANQASYQGTRHARDLARLVRPFLGRRILDAGAGDGSLLAALRALRPGAAVRGIDLAPKAPGVAAGDLTALEDADASYDAVLCSEVLEHLDPATGRLVLRELARVLAPGGYLIVTTPFEERLEDATVSCPGCGLEFHRWGHQQRFGARDLGALLAEAGLAPVELMPLRLNRLAKLAWLPSGLLRGPLRAFVAGRGGKRTLLAVGRR